jgi:hypothetical protein
MQMAAEDWRRLYDDCQKITQTITGSLSNGRPMTLDCFVVFDAPGFDEDIER